MKKKKVLVLGNFGYQTNQLDGQTIKTRSIYELLKKRELDFYGEVLYFDTQLFKSNKLAVLGMFRQLVKVKTLVYIGARSNLTYLFPFVFIIARLYRIRILYVAVGGWLDQYSRKPVHFWMLKHITGVFPQTQLLTEILANRYGFKNVVQLNNFRMVVKDGSNFSYFVDKSLLKLVFMGRVQQMKGIDALFKLDERLRSLGISNVSIDIYGPISAEYKLEFLNELEKHHFVSYKGTLLPDEIHATLRNYDLMLFPTRYYTEGFPGSILDAYIANVPVLASNWKFAHEFVEDGFSGLTANFNDDEDFINKSIDLVTNSDKLTSLKQTVKQYALRYSEEVAWGVLRSRI